MAESPEQAFAHEMQRVLPGRSERDQKHLFLGILSKCVPTQSRPILVGGSLVEYYSLGAITSLDIDLVGDRKTVARFLEAANFKKQDRHWIHPTWPLMVEVAGQDLRPTEAVKVLRMEGYTFLAVSPEDAIVDRLIAAEHWKSKQDWERAIVLATVLAPQLNWPALLEKAAKNHSLGSAQELRTLLKA